MGEALQVRERQQKLRGGSKDPGRRDLLCAGGEGALSCTSWGLLFDIKGIEGDETGQLRVMKVRGRELSVDN